MKQWTHAQANAYMDTFGHPSMVPKLEMTILLEIFKQLETKEEAQEPVMLVQDASRWPRVEIGTMARKELDEYTTKFVGITDVEIELIDQRDAELTKLEEIEDWGHDDAINFITGVTSIRSLESYQWKLIARKIELSVPEIQALIGPMHAEEKEKLIKRHTQELEALTRNHIKNARTT